MTDEEVANAWATVLNTCDDILAMGKVRQFMLSRADDTEFVFDLQDDGTWRCAGRTDIILLPTRLN